MKHVFIRELSCERDGMQQCLIKLGKDFFVISSLDAASDTGIPETLAFKADAKGEVLSWADLAGGRRKTREDTIRELEEKGAVKRLDRIFDSPFELLGSVLKGLAADARA